MIQATYPTPLAKKYFHLSSLDESDTDDSSNKRMTSLTKVMLASGTDVHSQFLISKASQELRLDNQSHTR